MPVWQIALIVLVAAWALQALGTFVQMRHYRSVMGDIATRWADGYVGAGNARARLGQGVIMVVVVGADMIVRRTMIMRGRSVFATFKPWIAFDGMPLERLRDGRVFPDAPRNKALGVAVAQIDHAARSHAVAA